MNDIKNNWGIDLIGRRMWYEPWPVDSLDNYRNPNNKEQEEIFCKFGEAVSETLLYFEECNGNTDKLINLLNDHVINKKYFTTREILLDKSRWYNNEYYFYFIMFTKKVIGRYDFHFGEKSNNLLSIFHSIYERGLIENIPWGIDENGNFIRDYSSELIYDIYNHVVNNFKNGKKIFDELINFINLLLKKHQNKYFDLSYFFDHNYWFTDEIIYYIYTFTQLLTNNNKIIYESILSVMSPLLMAIARILGSIKNIYKNIPYLAKKYDSILNYDIIKLTGNSCKIRYYHNEEMVMHKYILNRSQSREMIHIAKFISIPTVFNNSPMAKFIPIKSLTKGDAYFEGKFIWKNKTNFLNKIELLVNIIIITGIISFNFYSFKFENIYMLIILILLNISYFSIRKIFNFINFYKIFHIDFDTINKSKDELSIKLQNERDLMEQKVNKRTMELAQKNEQLKDLDKLKTNFFSNISHELRTPLTLILSYLKSIMDDNYDRITDKKNILKIIMQNGYKLLKLINNLLEFSKIEAGKMELKKDYVDIIKLIKVFISYIEPACRNKNIELKIIDNINSLETSIDTEKFETVFFNLFSNAFKFTPEGGKITIKLDTDDSFFNMSIADTGMGIQKNKLEMIFERFTQIDNSLKRKYEGTGIGLALTKEIIELHNGKILVDSSLNSGSTFIVKIPLTKNINTSFKKEYIEEKIIIKEELLNDFNEKKEINIITEFIPENKNILIVEDNINLVNLLVNSMKKKYNVYYALNGQEALDKIIKIPKPSVIISDIMMDIMDGYEFYDKLSEMKKFNDIPFIFLTAKTSVDEKIKGLSKGAIDYIYKPFIMEEINKKIDSIIKKNYLIKKNSIKKTTRKLLKKFNEKSMINFENNCKKFKITDREKVIIKLLFEGKINKEISSELQLSYFTIKNHIKNIYKKCNVQNKVELLNVFKKNKYINKNNSIQI